MTASTALKEISCRIHITHTNKHRIGSSLHPQPETIKGVKTVVGGGGWCPCLGGGGRCLIDIHVEHLHFMTLSVALWFCWTEEASCGFPAGCDVHVAVQMSRICVCVIHVCQVCV